jgi:hypothetical protein
VSSFKIALCSLAAFALMAQTPATPSKPLRHLEFAFTADYHFNGEGHSSGFGAFSGGGVKSSFGNGGRVGTVDVDVIGLAPDGALAFRINEWWEHELRPTQAINCQAEDTGEIICDNPFTPTDVEQIVLTALSRSFFDDSLVDAQGHWTRAYTNKIVKVTADYALTEPAPAGIVTIKATRQTVRVAGLGADWNEVETLTYDRALKTPDTIHEETDQGARGQTQEHSKIDIRITKDSFATVAAPPPAASPRRRLPRYPLAA